MQSTLDQPGSPVRADLRYLERSCVLTLAILALLTLLTWKLVPAAASLPPAWSLMHPTTAVAMLLAAAVIWASPPQASGWCRGIAWSATGLLVVLSLLSLGARHGSGRLSLDDWWVIGASGMPVQTAVGMLLLGSLLPITRIYRGTVSLAADVLTLLLVDCLLVMLMGYLFSLQMFFGEAAGIRVPPLSFLCLLTCAAVVVQRRSLGGVLAVLRGDGIGSRIVRVAIPLALLLPLALSLIRAYMVSHGVLEAAYATAASISVVCFGVTLLALLMGWRINRLEQEVRELLQKRSAAQLQESEQRYTDLVEQSISGFVVRRPDGRLILVNEAYRKMTGYSREELLELSARDLVVDQGVLERVRRLEPGQSAHIETFLKRKDGSLLEVEYVTQRMRNGNFQSVLLDISHRKQLQKQRDESERRYAELVEQAQEGISVRRATGGFLFVNDTFCRMLGYSREELLKLSIQDIVHPADAHTVQEVQHLGHGGHVRLEKRMVRKDGTVIYVEVSARRLRSGDVQSTVQDVTGRKQAEERFRVMVQGSPNAMLMVDESGTIAMANPQSEKLFGYKVEELLGHNVDMLVPDRVRAGHPGLRAGYNRDPHVRAMGADRELYALSKGGAEIPVEIGLNPTVTAEGRFVLVTILDISARKQAEEARLVSEQRYQDLVEQAADAIWLRDAGGRMLFVNDAGCRLLGYSREELLLSTSSQLIHASDPGTSARFDALAPFGTLRVERVMRHKDGHAIPVETSAHRLSDGSLQVISHDISERKRIEAELRQLSRRLGEAQEAERREIARELHDEIGQSLTATRINLRDLGQQTTSAPLQERVAATEEIISELLGKVRQMSLDLHPSVLDDLGLVPALRWCVRTRAGGSPLQVRLDLPEHLPRFDDMAEITLFRVFQEALSNVLKHAGAAHLDVHLEYTDGRLRLDIKDDGKGFDAAAARRAALSGKSLGLLGMQERVRLAGGEIAMDSAPGRGAEVRVSLPGEAR